MASTVLRFRSKSQLLSWGCVSGATIRALVGDWGAADSLARFLEKGGMAEAKRGGNGETFCINEVEIFSPITAPCQIICQGKNYREHMVETGIKNKEFNLLFTKADSTLTSAFARVKKPERVDLLDYELELALVLQRDLDPYLPVTKESLPDFVAGLVMANDISARDVQIPERQWFKGKSFRQFCPTGPFLVLLDKEDFAALDNLDLELWVNGELRQKSNTKLMLHKPAETLSEISGIFTMRRGDILLTGTPGGVAMRVKPKTLFQEILSSLKTDEQKFQEFKEEQRKSARYLKVGDTVESAIRSFDGKIDLGRQKWIVV